MTTPVATPSPAVSVRVTVSPKIKVVAVVLTTSILVRLEPVVVPVVAAVAPDWSPVTVTATPLVSKVSKELVVAMLPTEARPPVS